jgi:nitrate reductase NapAB chaperone NapD
MFKRKSIESVLQEMKYIDKFFVNDSSERKGELFVIEQKTNEDRIYELEQKVKELENLLKSYLVVNGDKSLHVPCKFCSA